MMKSVPQAVLDKHLGILGINGSGKTKTCTRCGTARPPSQYGENWNNRNGRYYTRPHCRVCDVDMARQYRKTPAGKASRVREHRRQFERNYGFFKSIKAELKCCACGEADTACIDFHHVDPRKKRRALADSIRVSIKRLSEELMKCVCLCANCHRKLHANRLSLSPEILTISRAQIETALEHRASKLFDDGGSHLKCRLRTQISATGTS